MPITESDVERLVAVAPSKTCELDPIPTWLLKQCSSELVPLITTIINASLTKSVVPPDFKRAVIRPLLKKFTLDKKDYKTTDQFQICLSLRNSLKKWSQGKLMITLMGTRCEIKCNLHTVQATRQKPRCCESRTISMRHSTERAWLYL